MSKAESKHDKCSPYISEIINSTDNINILTDKLIVFLIKMHNEGKDFNETKHFINKCITLSSQSMDDVFNWLKKNQNESKYIFFLGFFYHNKYTLEENRGKGFKCFLKAAED